MIDTLKLSKKLQQAGMEEAQADAIADGVSEGIKENYVTNERLDAALAKLKSDIIFWIVGTVGLGTIIQVLLHH